MDPRPRNIFLAIALALALAAVPPAHGAWLPYGTPAAVAPSTQDQVSAGLHTFAGSRERSTEHLAGGVYFTGLVSPEERASRKLVLPK